MDPKDILLETGDGGVSNDVGGVVLPGNFLSPVLGFHLRKSFWGRARGG